VKSLATRVRAKLNFERGLMPNMHAMDVTPTTSGESVEQVLAHLRADPAVEYAVVDRPVHAHAVSNDPLATGQWYLQATQKSAINANAAWDLTKGSDGLVIGVIDTGVRFDHPDLGRASQSGRLLPGWDFITSTTTANDGDARDPDASDPGDWNTAGQCGSSGGGGASDSSWHGTRTSGIIGALTDNGTGVAGITWKTWILPVRALGRCGGNTSDVLAGMLWASGQHVAGIPDNQFPARVLNLSLGSTGSCDAASQSVVNTLVSHGVLVVASAGNEGGPVDAPANCAGAAGILGLRHAGTKVGFSSLGPEIALGAPGGNCVNTAGGPCLFSIDTTFNLGVTTPGVNSYTDQINSNVGTSFSAPIVTGIAGLMLAVNGNLNATQLIARLREGATPFPATSDTVPAPPACHVPTGPTDLQTAECICTTSACGAGMANALGAVNAALRPIAAMTAATAGGNVSLQGGGSAAACGHTISTFDWTAPPGTTVINPHSATASVQTPGSGTVTVHLTVTDDAGKQDSADVAISSTDATTSAPATAGTTACLASITIPQQLPPSQITVIATDAAAVEPGTDTGTFTFSRTGDTTASLAVSISLSGTAINGTSYQSIGNTVTFAAGASTATLTVTPLDNMTVDASRTVIVTLQPDTSYDVASPSSATVTIADNDTAASSTSGGKSGGGGGGRFDALLLCALGLTLMLRKIRHSYPLSP
jgi:serine protease